MNNYEFEQFVQADGKDILRFCRMTAKNNEDGDELYQDTMLKLIEKMDSLDTNQSVKSYALSISILLWKNKKKKLARRFHIIPTESLEQLEEDGKPVNTHNEPSTEEKVLQKQEIRFVQDLVATLPEKYRIPLYLYYSANMQISEIGKCMKLPEGTIKSRMRKAKALLKKKLEALEYDR